MFYITFLVTLFVPYVFAGGKATKQSKEVSTDDLVILEKDHSDSPTFETIYGEIDAMEDRIIAATSDTKVFTIKFEILEQLGNFKYCAKELAYIQNPLVPRKDNQTKNAIEQATTQKADYVHQQWLTMKKDLENLLGTQDFK
jgi:hypothetical protein